MISSKWSYIGYAIAVLFEIMNIVRYYFIYPDIDKCLAYTLIAILICAVSWLYNKQLVQGKDIEYLEDGVQDMKFEENKVD